MASAENSVVCVCCVCVGVKPVLMCVNHKNVGYPVLILITFILWDKIIL